MNKKYNYVYQTKNLINGKTYIGVHSTSNLNDGYIGCSIYRQPTESLNKWAFQKAVKKYGYDNFKKEILSFYDTLEEAYEEEKWLITENWVKSTNNYNIATGGLGGWTHVNLNKNKFIRKGKDNPMYGRTGSNNSFFGKTHSKKTRKHLSKVHTGKIISEETKIKMSNSSNRLSGKDHPMYGRNHSNEAKELMTKSLLNRHKTKEGKLNHIKAFKYVRKVKNLITGEEFISMKDAAKESGVEYREFIRLLKENKILKYKILQ